MATTTIPKIMKGLQITEFKKSYHYSENIPVPKIERDNQVLIKVAVAGYCHTDMMVQDGLMESNMKSLGKSLLLIPTHEGTGIIVAVGSRVSGLKVDDRVGALTLKNPCGTFNSNGAAAEYMVADSNFTVLIPPSLSSEAAAPLMCAGTTIYHGLKTANLKSGQSVAIIGAGALGHLGIQFAKCMGLRVVCVDARQAPLDLVKTLKYAPDYAIDATKGVEYALQEIGGEGVDATIMATDSLPAHEYGLQLTRKHGTFVVPELPSDLIPVHYNYLILRNITIKGSLLGNAKGTKEMVDLVAEKRIEVKARVYPLTEVETLTNDYHKDTHAGKLVLRVSQDD